MDEPLSVGRWEPAPSRREKRRARRVGRSRLSPGSAEVSREVPGPNFVPPTMALDLMEAEPVEPRQTVIDLDRREPGVVWVALTEDGRMAGIGTTPNLALADSEDSPGPRAHSLVRYPVRDA